MSKDMLGPLTRALVGVPAKMLNLILDIANRLGSDDAETFYSDLAKFVRGWKKTVAETTKRVVKFVSLPPVTDDGRNGQEFVEVMEENGFDFGDWAKDVMTVGRDANGELIVRSTSGVTYKPVVVKGEEFTDNERITSNIRKVAEEMKFITPPWWLGPLLRETMTDEQIGALGLDWLIVMHEPVTDSVSVPILLGLYRYHARNLRVCRVGPVSRWYRRDGFVFLAPQG